MRVYSAFEAAHLIRLGYVPVCYRADGDGRNAYAEFNTQAVRLDLAEYREAMTEVHAAKAAAVRTRGVSHEPDRSR
jgi:hypothetical protein